MNMTLHFTETQAQEILAAAARLGMSADEFAREAVLTFVASTGRDFDSAAEYVLRKNAELYKRLS